MYAEYSCAILLVHVVVVDSHFTCTSVREDLKYGLERISDKKVNGIWLKYSGMGMPVSS
jgi:hypothetical protein